MVATVEETSAAHTACADHVAYHGYDYFYSTTQTVRAILPACLLTYLSISLIARSRCFILCLPRPLDSCNTTFTSTLTPSLSCPPYFSLWFFLSTFPLLLSRSTFTAQRLFVCAVLATISLDVSLQPSLPVLTAVPINPQVCRHPCISPKCSLKWPPPSFASGLHILFVLSHSVLNWHFAYSPLLSILFPRYTSCGSLPWTMAISYTWTRLPCTCTWCIIYPHCDCHTQWHYHI